MPNHWHLVLWPNAQGELSAFLHWLTLTHTQRWKAHYQQIGRGHLYQGRFKSFPIQEDEHLLTVCRYVEQNALRAGLADRAEVWQWGSLGHRKAGNSELAHHFTEWPVPRPVDWHEQVNTALTENELKTLRSCVNRGTPFGYSHWIASTAKQLGLESSLRNRGRPRKSIPNQEC